MLRWIGAILLLMLVGFAGVIGYGYFAGGYHKLSDLPNDAYVFFTNHVPYQDGANKKSELLSFLYKGKFRR